MRQSFIKQKEREEEKEELHARSGSYRNSSYLIATTEASAAKKEVIPNSSTGGTQSHEPSLLPRRV